MILWSEKNTSNLFFQREHHSTESPLLVIRTKMTITYFFFKGNNSDSAYYNAIMRIKKFANCSQ